MAKGIVWIKRADGSRQPARRLASGKLRFIKKSAARAARSRPRAAPRRRRNSHRRRKVRAAVQRMRRSRPRRASPMARKKRSGGRRSKSWFTLTTALPLVKIGGEVLFGRAGHSSGLVQGLQGGGDPKKALLETADLLACEFSGYNPGLATGAPKWDLALPVENGTLAVVGKVGHWGANKLGVNRMLAKMNVPIRA